MPAGPWSGLEFAAILAPGGDPATDMSLCFVFVQNFLDLEIQAPVVEGKPFLYVFMFGRYELEWFHPAQDYQATGDKYPRFHLCLLQFFG